LKLGGDPAPHRSGVWEKGIEDPTLYRRYIEDAGLVIETDAGTEAIGSNL